MRPSRKLSRPFAVAAALLLLTGCPLMLNDEFRLGESSDGAGGGAGGTGGTGTGGTLNDRRERDAGSAGSLPADPQVPACTGPACPNLCTAAAMGPANVCGCGVPEPPACAALERALSHRYRFDGTGTQVLDTIGTAHGTVIGTTLGGDGYLDLAGGSADDYVDLPNGVVSSLASATFEIWLIWHGGGAWQRIFDFGTSTDGEDDTGTGETYLFLTPEVSENSDFDGVMRLTYSGSGGDEEVELNAVAALPQEREVHVAVVVDGGPEGAGKQLSLYQDGELVASMPFAESLSALDDVNNWLGRSQFIRDDALDARLLEFRIYAAALDADAIRTSFQAGPDAEFLEN
jgi:hypothetical protein